MDIRLKSILAALLIIGLKSKAEIIQLQSPLDKFSLSIEGEQARVDGKSADMRSLANLISIMENPLGATCAKIATPPLLTVTKQNQKRFFYPEQGLVTDGSKCLNVAGDGLFYLPIHRAFLIGSTVGQIRIGPSITLLRDGKKILSVKSTTTGWENDLPEQLPNWSFIEGLSKSLPEHEIRLRVQTGIANKKPKIILQTGGRDYEFYKITEIMWAAREGNDQWLSASDAWSNWYNLDAKVLNDPFSDTIRLAGNSKEALEKRSEALESLSGTWNPNVRDLYEHILLNDKEDLKLQTLAFQNIKRRPSLRSAGIMVRVLESSLNADFKRQAANALRLQNPSGPKFNPNAKTEEQNQALEFWRNWWKQNSQKP